MSGHSKWHNIQKQKGKVDAQRGKLFTKLAKEISVAVKEGGDAAIDANPRLRAAVTKAKGLSMPKDNIERAIKRGAGGAGEGALEEVVYEGFGPGGVAFIVTALTDNRNRTAASVREIFKKTGGSIGANGSVAWMFDYVGVVRIKKEDILDRDSFELEVIDVGVADIVEDDGLLELIFPMQEYGKVSSRIEELGVKEPESSGLEYVAKDVVVVDPDVEEKIRSLIDKLDDDDDVQSFFTNAA